MNLFSSQFFSFSGFSMLAFQNWVQEISFSIGLSYICLIMENAKSIFLKNENWKSEGQLHELYASNQIILVFFLMHYKLGADLELRWVYLPTRCIEILHNSTWGGGCHPVFRCFKNNFCWQCKNLHRNSQFVGKFLFCQVW